VKRGELERLLATVDELEDARRRLHRAEVLEREIEHDRVIATRAPDVERVALGRRDAIEPILRGLERQWVSQGPLVANWQRAVELEQQAESAGVDPTVYRADVDDARRTVEAARLETRDWLGQLTAERETLMDAAVEAPFEVEPAPPVGDDDRPEAARRQALALTERAVGIAEAAVREREQAERRLAEATAELEAIGSPAALAERERELRAQIPDVVTFSGSEPPSAAMRLERVGVQVDRQPSE
jgi:hypothetical protein